MLGNGNASARSPLARPTSTARRCSIRSTISATTTPTSCSAAATAWCGRARRAVVTINVGLLGTESPLPSYMLKLADASTDRLVPFFEYFDHTLLRSRMRMLWPERDSELGLDWSRTRRDISKLVRMDSPAMAHWLFRHIYPELEVSVRRQLTTHRPPAFRGSRKPRAGSASSCCPRSPSRKWA
jgi:hypothetical protein